MEEHFGFNTVYPAAITSRGTVKSFEIPQEQFALGSETGFARKQHQAPFIPAGQQQTAPHTTWLPLPPSRPRIFGKQPNPRWRRRQM
jgi:hypothetical protein